MTLESTLIRRAVLVGAFALVTAATITRLTVAQTPSHILLVVSSDARSLLFTDPLDGEVMGRAPLGVLPNQVAVSADGKLAFVTNRKSDSISVIDVAARKELRHVDLGSGSQPHGIVFAGGKLYFTARGKKVIGCYDPASAQIVDWLLGSDPDFGDGMLVVAKDLNTIFTDNNGSDNITAFKRVSDSQGEPSWNLTVIPLGKKPNDSERQHGIDISPDGKELWAVNPSGSLSIIDVATLQVTRTLNVPGNNLTRLKFTPDGKLVLVSNRTTAINNITTRRDELVVLDAGARKEIKRFELDGGVGGILVLPDSSRAYVSLTVSNDIENIDLKTLKVTSRFSTGSKPEGMAWVEIR